MPHQQVKRYLVQTCNNGKLETEYGVDKYADAYALAKLLRTVGSDSHVLDTVKRRLYAVFKRNRQA